MGPEHSSARLERFLQMTDDEPDTFPDDFTDEGYEQVEPWTPLAPLPLSPPYPPAAATLHSDRVTDIALLGAALYRPRP